MAGVLVWIRFGSGGCSRHSAAEVIAIAVAAGLYLA